MKTSKKITMGALGAVVVAGSVGAGISDGLGSGFSAFAVSLFLGVAVWWIFFED